MIKINIYNINMGIGDWGLGIGHWGLGPIPSPQSPIPNKNIFYFLYFLLKNKLYIFFVIEHKF